MVSSIKSFAVIGPRRFEKEISKLKVQLPITDHNLIRRAASTGQAFNMAVPTSMNDWLNRCTYSCKICETHTSQNYSTFLAHIQCNHLESKRSYTEKFGQIIDQIVSHTCQLCGRILEWDRTLIKAHLTRCHLPVTVETYFGRYQHTYAENLRLAEDGNDGGAKVEWPFECKECRIRENFRTEEELAGHLQVKHHGITLETYSEKHKIFISKPTTFGCEICQRCIDGDRISFESHLEGVHKIGSDDYFDAVLARKCKVDVIDVIKTTLKSQLLEDYGSVLKWSDRCQGPILQNLFSHY